MVIIIDNYDSFTYNLADLFFRQTDQVEVIRNDKITLKQIREREPRGIVFSPGPGRPEESGLCPQIYDEFGGKVPFLGICLGHQLMGIKSGGVVKILNHPLHGKTSLITHDQAGIFQDIPEEFVAMRYHSLVITPSYFSSGFSYAGGRQHSLLSVSAKTNDGLIMGFRHNFWPSTESVQFHPESIQTQHGEKMIKNWLLMIGQILNIKD